LRTAAGIVQKLWARVAVRYATLPCTSLDSVISQR
jgi:hypothetical protein